MSRIPIIPNHSLFEAAKRWISRGASLLPCRHDSKFLLSGYGPVKRTIKDPYLVEKFFKVDGYNLAVFLPASMFCLDFDDSDLFNRWSDATPAELQVTVTQTSRVGWHLFFRGSLPADSRLVPGVEVKRVVIVAPSIVQGIKYTDIGIDEVREIPDVKSLLSFLLLSNPDPEPAIVTDRAGSSAGDSDLIAHIKETWPIYETASHLTKLEPSPRGQTRWYRGRCPLHSPDNHPSFWLDAQRGTWGCFSCTPKGGDVINLVAAHEGISVQDAIKALARRSPSG